MKALFTLFICAVLALGTLGCKTARSYKTLRSVAVAVDAALMAYGDAYQAGRITPEQRTAIKAAHLRYQSAMTTAVLAAQLNIKRPAPADLVALASSLIATVNVATGRSTP